MSLVQDMQTDIDIFYDISGFGKECIYNENTIVYLERDDIEVEEFKQKCIQVRNSEIVGIKEGDVLKIASKDYEVLNRSPLGELETLILLKVKNV